MLGRVFDGLGRVVVQQRIELPGIDGGRTCVEIVDISVDVAAELLVDHLFVDRRQVPHVFTRDTEHTFGHLAVRGHVVVLIEILHALAHGRTLLVGHRIVQAEDHIGGRPESLDRTEECLADILARGENRRLFPDRLLDERQRVDKTLLGQRVGLGPLLEFGLLRLFLALHVEFADAARHADRILPVIRRSGIFRSVLDAHLVAGGHVLLEDRLTLAADEDALGVRNVEHLVDLVRGHVTLGRSGKAHNHREVVLLVAVERHLEVFHGFIGHVVGRIGRRFVVLAGIDAENGEVARVARPHPVVGLAAELADRRGGRTDQTHVRELLDHEGEVLVPAEEVLDLNLHAGVFGRQLVGERLRVFADDFRALLLRSDIGDIAQQIGRYIGDLTDETHRQPRSRQLLGVGHGPETVPEVVVIHRRKFLNRSVAAVVVGENEPFGRHDQPLPKMTTASFKAVRLRL